MDIIDDVGFTRIFITPDHSVFTNSFVGQSHRDSGSDALLAGEVVPAASDDDDDPALAPPSLEDAGIGTGFLGKKRR